MDETSVQAAPDKPLPETAPVVLKDVRRTPPSPVFKFFKALGSLRLTVALFLASIGLVFAGTWAQIDAGIWTVVTTYFRTFFVLIPFQIFLPATVHVPGGIPWPGGWTIGGLLLLNIFSAYGTRIRSMLHIKRSGILLLHAGVVVMLLSELVTGLFAVEGNMSIDEGKSSNFVEHNRYCELAVVDSSAPKEDDVVAIPGSRLRKGGLIKDEALPFDVEVDKYMINSHLVRAKETQAPNPATIGAGAVSVAIPEGEVAGTAQKQAVEVPSVYVTLKKKSDGSSLGTWLFSLWLNPQPVVVDGKTYDVSLRFLRTYKPYSLRLIEFRFDRYPGTNTPRNYSSKVELVDTDRREDREVVIRMNEPLRHRGEAIFQADFDKKTEKTTVLQVVTNPGWMMPYISCGMVSFGMLFTFGMHLVGFLSRRVES